MYQNPFDDFSTFFRPCSISRLVQTLLQNSYNRLTSISEMKAVKKLTACAKLRVLGAWESPSVNSWFASFSFGVVLPLVKGNRIPPRLLVFTFVCVCFWCSAPPY
jgi:hypothetical protein